jgi:hypothetical protein
MIVSPSRETAATVMRVTVRICSSAMVRPSPREPAGRVTQSIRRSPMTASISSTTAGVK